MASDRTEFRPFAVESRARPCRLAFLVNADTCQAELLDALFEANYGLWGGRFNPIIPVRDGEVSEPFWCLLKYVDPDIVYTYAPLSEGLVKGLERDLVPCRIEVFMSDVERSK